MDRSQPAVFIEQVSRVEECDAREFIEQVLFFDLAVATQSLATQVHIRPHRFVLHQPAGCHGHVLVSAVIPGLLVRVVPILVRVGEHVIAESALLRRQAKLVHGNTVVRAFFLGPFTLELNFLRVGYAAHLSLVT